MIFIVQVIGAHEIKEWQKAFETLNLTCKPHSPIVQIVYITFITPFCCSLVPDLAPERLILQHGLSTSYENLTIHSVNSSPDVTLLSVRSYRNDVTTTCFPDVTIHSHQSSGSDTDTSPRGGWSDNTDGIFQNEWSHVDLSHDYLKNEYMY